MSRGLKPDILKVIAKKRASIGQPLKRLANKNKADLSDVPSSKEKEDRSREEERARRRVIVSRLVMRR